MIAFTPKILVRYVFYDFQLMKLDNLAIYWNTKDLFKNDMTTKEWLVSSFYRISVRTPLTAVFEIAN